MPYLVICLKEKLSEARFLDSFFWLALFINFVQIVFFPFIYLAMDQQVGYVIGQLGNDLYGIARNNRAYMRKRGKEGAWYGIEEDVWKSAKRDSGLVEKKAIEENHTNTGDPESDFIKGKWGGNICASTIAKF